MLDQNAIAPAAPPVLAWDYSPNPAVEAALVRLRRQYPPHLPAGLARFSALLAKLGDPHLSLPPVFHVAGTNGKGSTVAFLQAAFEAGGHSVHRFTSPHLVRFSERIVLGGRQMPDDLLLAMIAEVEQAAAGDISFFEFFTALAFLAFARHPAEAVLLETGLGGLFDATNVILRPAAAVLTRISFDHMRILGDTLPEIAAQKAGIIKPGAPVVIAPQAEPAVLEVFLQAAAQKGAGPVAAAGRDFFVLPRADGFEYRGREIHVTLPPPALAGAHQMLNAGCAIAALEAAGHAGLCAPDVLACAMRNVRWPGRLQRLVSGALPGLLPPGWEIWLDGAHNDSGAEVLAAHIRNWRDGRPVHLVTAFKDKKDTEGFYRHLAGLFVTVQAAAFSVAAPMVPPAEIVSLLREKGFAAAREAENLPAALAALAESASGPARVVVAGSLYLVGHALKINGEAAA